MDPPRLANDSLGTWLVSEALGAPQTFSCGGRTWLIMLRPARYYKPYSVTLAEVHPRTLSRHRNPEEFRQPHHLIDPERSINRDVLIYMNHPLRYRGETYYQAGFKKDDRRRSCKSCTTRASSRLTSPASSSAAGLLVQFGYHLVGFSRRTKDGARMKRFSLDSFCSSPLVWLAANWLPPKTAHGRFRSFQVWQDSRAGRRTRQATRYRRAQFSPHHSRQTGTVASTTADALAPCNG